MEYKDVADEYCEKIIHLGNDDIQKQPNNYVNIIYINNGEKKY